MQFDEVFRLDYSEMSLSRYLEKRSFDISSEPKGGKPTSAKLRFVIQKHAASHLHYDFRLEIGGILKSWAIPKGPSLNIGVKRLAMMVEDHPYDYRNFEGIIPAGEYGAGAVIIWDEGTYEVEGLKGKSKLLQVEHLLDELEKGNIKIALRGKKLNGGFALVKIHGKGENTWLLIKHTDKFASSEDITLNDESVVSGKTIEQIIAASITDNQLLPATDRRPDKQKLPAADRQHDKQKLPATDRRHDKQKLPAADRRPASDNDNPDQYLQDLTATPMPKGIKPMLATLVDSPFNNKNYSFEVKFDGYRALAYLNDEQVDLISRNKKSFNEKFYPIYDLLTTLKLNAVFDGEIIVLNQKGVSDFSRLQNWRSEADGELVYYVFDILWLSGKDLRSLPLYQRQSILKRVFPTTDDRLRQSMGFKSKGVEFFKAVSDLKLEGMLAKNLNSKYSDNLRSKDWLKIKVHKRQEVIIAGYTRNQDTKKRFSSLLLAVYRQGLLHFAGKVGTGFSDHDQLSLISLFKPLVIHKSPFEKIPDINKPSRFRSVQPDPGVIWLKPQLVCEVSFTEVTAEGVFRHPSFQGMRTDKKAKDVINEIESETSVVLESQILSTRKTLLNPKDETQVRTVCGHDLKLTNLSKVYWPKDGISKRDLINYYHQIADFILPYLKDRPLSLNRFPGGIEGQAFYQKDVSKKAPEWAITFPYTNTSGKHKKYLIGNDEATLIWMSSLGCIEMNPWFSRVKNLDNPDYCVIDLDPDKNTFDQVIQAALVVKKIFDELKIVSYPKTSGSTGMHIYIPLGGNYTYEQSQLFAKIIVRVVHAEIPEFTSLERLIKNRHGKMYLDYLQNRAGATIACPYSLRPKPGATVSMPLHWEEVKPGLKMHDFTIHNAPDRLSSTGDLFKGVLGEGIKLEEIVLKAEKIFQL